MLESTFGKNTRVDKFLGVRLQQSHHSQHWFHDPKTDYSYNQNGPNISKFYRSSEITRTNQIFHLQNANLVFPEEVRLVTVDPITDDVVTI